VESRPAFERAAGWLRERPRLVDAALAGLLLLVLVGASTTTSQEPTGGAATAAVGVLLLLPLAWRRSAPVPAAAVVLVAGLLELAVSPKFMAANVGVLAMVYALAAYAPWRASRAGLLLGLLGAVLATLRYFAGSSLSSGLSAGSIPELAFSCGAIGALVLASWALGDLRRVRLRQVADLEERARLLEQERDQERLLAAAGERARIAREMHDVVAHSLSVVIAQADGGRYAARADPGAATGALDAIAVTGRQALSDMRGLLGVLRDGDAQAYAPQPDVTAVEALVEEVRVSGVDVDLLVDGTPRGLPAGAQLVAYRVVQESLTNVLKHAGPACRVWVRLHWREDCLEVQVADDGRGAAAVHADGDGAGQGLSGMRERVRLHGGSLEAAVRPAGGFGVHAVLPYPLRR